MAVPKNKEELILTIGDSYSKVKKELEAIPYELTTNKELEGYKQ